MVKIYYTLPQTNLPYSEEMEDRPSFYDATTKQIDKEGWINKYYPNSLIEKEAQLTRINTNEAYFEIATNNYSEVEEIRRKNHIKIRYEDNSYSQDVYWFIGRPQESAGDMIRFNLRLDYWLNYWGEIELNNRSVMVNREHEKRYNNIEQDITPLDQGDKKVVFAYAYALNRWLGDSFNSQFDDNVLGNTQYFYSDNSPSGKTFTIYDPVSGDLLFPTYTNTDITSISKEDLNKSYNLKYCNEKNNIDIFDNNGEKIPLNAKMIGNGCTPWYSTYWDLNNPVGDSAKVQKWLDNLPDCLERILNTSGLDIPDVSQTLGPAKPFNYWNVGAWEPQSGDKPQSLNSFNFDKCIWKEIVSDEQFINAYYEFTDDGIKTSDVGKWKNTNNKQSLLSFNYKLYKDGSNIDFDVPFFTNNSTNRSVDFIGDIFLYGIEGQHIASNPQSYKFYAGSYLWNGRILPETTNDSKINFKINYGSGQTITFINDAFFDLPLYQYGIPLSPTMIRNIEPNYDYIQINNDTLQEDDKKEIGYIVYEWMNNTYFRLTGNNLPFGKDDEYDVLFNFTSGTGDTFIFNQSIYNQFFNDNTTNTNPWGIYKETKTSETSSIKYDFKNLKSLWLSDNNTNQYKPNFNYTPNTYLPRTLNTPYPYTNNENIAQWEKGKDKVYAYGLISILSNQIGIDGGLITGKGQDDKVETGDKFSASNGGSSMTYLVCPLDIRAYNLFIKAGNECVAKIIVSKTPLIDDYDWERLDKLSDYGKFVGISDDDTIKVIPLDSINKFPLRYFEKTKTWRDVFYLNETPNGNEEWDYNKEIQIYTPKHFKFIYRNGLFDRDVQTSKLWGLDNSEYFTSYNNIGINGTNYLIKGQIQEGYYGQGINQDQRGYILNDTSTLPDTSNAYTNYLQQHVNTFNTSKWALKGGLGFGIAGDVLGGVSDLGKSALGFGFASSQKNNVGLAQAGAISGGVSGILGTGLNIGKDIFNYKKGMRMLNSKLEDFENNPMKVQDINDRDNFSLLFSLVDKGSFETNQAMLIPMELSDNEKRIVAQHYHMNGYEVDYLRNFEEYTQFSEVRNRFNFWEIDSFRNLISLSAGIEIQDWFNNFFEKGARLWNYKDQWGNDVDMLDFSKENWEQLDYAG